MPLLGLGTSKAGSEQLAEAIKVAIDEGYRLFDCAWRYHNLEAVGKGIRAKIEDGTVKREEIFVTAKLWRAFMRKEHMDECMNDTLEKLGLDYVDLFLIHFPEASLYAGLFHNEMFDDDGQIIVDEDIHYTETWNHMQKFVEDGRARMLGVSNFNCYQMKKLLEDCKEVPVVNQIEVHPYLTNVELVELCQAKGVAVTAFCSIGTTDRGYCMHPSNFPALLQDPVLDKIAKKHGKTSAQTALRFSLDRGIAVIPKSVTPSRIRENMDVFDFKLDEGDVQELLNLNRNHRFMGTLWHSHHKYYPFKDNYSE